MRSLRSRSSASSSGSMRRVFLYVLRCADGSLYTGIADDVAARLEKHASGKGAKYTRGRGPLTLVAKTRCRDRSLALRAELAFKRLSRSDKELVLARPRGLLAFVRKIVASARY